MSSTSTVDTDNTVPVELAVSGMTCAACAARVERKLNKLDGVSASVNYATEKAAVQIAEHVEQQSLIAEVQRAGYDATVIDPGETPGEDDEQVRGLWRRLVAALLLGVPVMDLSFTMALVPSLRFPGWQWVLLAMALPVVTWSAWPFHRKALITARHGSSSMDTLVSLGIVASVSWSVYAMFAHGDETASTDGVLGLLLQPGGAVYLDVAVGVTVFVLAGRLFEAKAKHRAGGALRALGALGAKDVAVLRDGDEQRVPVEELGVGEHFVVRPGETIATDGEVVRGNCTVDTSAMTGESTPVEIAAGEQVVGGTIALGGHVVVRASKIGADTQLAQLVTMVERAQNDKAAVQRLADRISAWFVPAVCALSLITFGSWWALGAPPEQSFSAALAVLIIACPCALGLATPTALLAASGRGAQLGIFIKGHQALESARAIDTVVLDKTGTLTAGEMGVVELRTAPGVQRSTALRRAAAVENGSEHVVARAIVSLARGELDEIPAVDDFANLPGLGACGVVDGHAVLIGSTRMLGEYGVTIPPEFAEQCAAWEQRGNTTVVVAVDEEVHAILAVADTIKPSASRAVAGLHRLGLRTVLLSGDNESTTRAVAAEVGIDEVLAEVLPADKAATIERLRGEGRTVAMVGDGVNDAPALAGADLGMAVVSGTDVALGAADLILVRDDLDVVPSAVALARTTLRTIRGNLLWAFGYNVAALPIAAFGLLNPLIAVAAMALSSMLVVTNSLRLRSFRER